MEKKKNYTQENTDEIIRKFGDEVEFIIKSQKRGYGTELDYIAKVIHTCWNYQPNFLSFEECNKLDEEETRQRYLQAETCETIAKKAIRRILDGDGSI